MPLATGFARSSDVKLEVSRGHSRGNLKGRTLTTRVEVTALMTNSSGPPVQTDVGANIPNVQYSYRSLRRRSDEQAGKKQVLPGEIRFDATGYGLREEFGCQIGSQPRP